MDAVNVGTINFRTQLMCWDCLCNAEEKERMRHWHFPWLGQVIFKSVKLVLPQQQNIDLTITSEKTNVMFYRSQVVLIASEVLWTEYKVFVAYKHPDSIINHITGEMEVTLYCSVCKKEKKGGGGILGMVSAAKKVFGSLRIYWRESIQECDNGLHFKILENKTRCCRRDCFILKEEQEQITVYIRTRIVLYLSNESCTLWAEHSFWFLQWNALR